MSRERTNSASAEGLRRLGERYASHPMLRGLVQIIPLGVGSALDSVLTTHLENIREDRLRTFFDEIEKGEVALSPEVIESEDFLHAYFSTLNAAAKTRRREKIKLFAHLLLSGATGRGVNNSDEYEDYLAILEDLSYRELVLLAALERNETFGGLRTAENPHATVAEYWNLFLTGAALSLGISKDEVAGMLVRLTRTGCFEFLPTGRFNSVPGIGRLTPTYAKLKQLVGDVGESPEPSVNLSQGQMETPPSTT